MKSPDSCPLLHPQLFNRNHSTECQYHVMTSEINMIWVILGHTVICGCVTSVCIYLKCSQMFVCRWNAAARLVVTPAAAAWHSADQSEARVDWHLTNQRPVSGQGGSQGWSVVTADTAEAGERHSLGISSHIGRQGVAPQESRPWSRGHNTSHITHLIMTSAL